MNLGSGQTITRTARNLPWGSEHTWFKIFKRVASPGSMHDTGCLGLVHWDNPEGCYVEGGGFRMGNTCIPMADSFRYLAKLIQFCKV